MNAVPVRYERIIEQNTRNEYFHNLVDKQIDIAYLIFEQFTLDELANKFRDPLTKFALQAREAGVVSCIQISSSTFLPDTVSLDEAEYDKDNNVKITNDGCFVASVASEKWKEYLKKIISLLVADIGFDQIVLTEPESRVGLPGTRDRFYDLFKLLNEDIDYPSTISETSEFIKLQHLRTNTLIDFYKDIAVFAKSIGAKKVGLAPMRFAPDYHNESSPEIICCDIGRITRIDEIDYVVSKTRHCNKHSLKMSDACWNCYIEVLTHSSAKPVMIIEFPQDNVYDPVKETRAVLASLSASPAGFIVNEWKSSLQESSILIKASKYCSRLGQPRSSIAFVFSDNGTKHAPPYNYDTVFKQFWKLAVKMASTIKQPILVFYAETLKEDIARHPEVKALVIEEHFPLSLDNMMVIRDWWKSNEKQAVIAFGSGEGFSADSNISGLQPSGKAFPGILELIGLSQEETRQIVLNEKLILDDVSKIKRASCLGSELEYQVSGIANLRRVFGSRANILYETTINEEKIPVIAEWRDRTTLALFCGFGITNNTLDAAEKILRYALKDVDVRRQVFFDTTTNLLWSKNKNEYIVTCNLSDDDGCASVDIGRADLWDCIEQKIADISDAKIYIKPNDFKVFRIVSRRSKFLDIIGAASINGLVDGAGRAELDIYAGKSTILVLRTPPKEVIVDGRITPTTSELVGDNYNVILRLCPPGQRNITVKW